MPAPRAPPRRRSRPGPAPGWPARPRPSARGSAPPREPSLASGEAARGAMAEEHLGLAHRAAPDVGDGHDARRAQAVGRDALEVEVAPAPRAGGELRGDLVADLVAAGARRRADGGVQVAAGPQGAQGAPAPPPGARRHAPPARR